MPIAASLPEIEPGLVLAWLGTYLLHSTLLLGTAWAASRVLRGRALGVEEGLWKAALVGSLLTASLQLGLAVLPQGDAPEAATAAVTASAPAGLGTAWLLAAGTQDPAARPAADPRLRTFAAVLPGWQRFALAGWVSGAALLLAGLGLSWLRLRLRLRDRREVAAGPARLLLDRLLGGLADGGARRRVRRSVRLSGTPALPVPVALGVGEREICLPRRALTKLGERRQRGLLAHELAHLERRDPAWLLAARAMESLFFFQPLNRLARSRLQEISELRCDAWAVEATGDRVGLARCLTEVAGWLTEDRSLLPVPGMARGRKNLGERVRRVLEGTGEAGGAGRRWLPAAAAVLLVGGAALVPGIAPESFATPEPPAAAPDAQPPEPATPPPSEEPGAPAPRPEPAPDPVAEWDDDRHFEHDYDHDFDHDFDFAHDFDFEAMAEAMAAAHAAMPDAAELARIHEEMERAMREVEGSMPDEAEMARIHEEVERALREARASMPDDAAMALVREELARIDHHLRDEVERELRRAHEELERAHREVRREVRGEREEVRREVRREVEEARRELERQRREMEREMTEARRELEERQRELDERRRELELRRQELEERRQELREARGEEQEEP